MFTDKNNITRYYKNDIKKLLREGYQLTVDGANLCYEAFVETMKKVILAGDVLDIPEIGSFQNKLQKSRTARNPKTNILMIIPARYKPVFTPAKKFREECNDGKE